MTDPAKLIAIYAEAVGRGFPIKIRDVLARIPDARRRLLAIRGYLRTKRNVDTDWAWTNAQYDAFRKTIADDQLRDELKLVFKQFADANAGYELGTAATFRPLERQIQLWNTYASISAPAARLHALATAELSRPLYDTDARPPTSSSSLLPGPPAPLGYGADARSAFVAMMPTTPRSIPAALPADLRPLLGAVGHFKAFLKQSAPGTVMVATPGLSDHGHVNAIDFLVKEKNGPVVASAAVKTWHGPDGWGAKLASAMAKTRFTGPLANPPEPWHWTIHLPTDSFEVPKPKR